MKLLALASVVTAASAFTAPTMTFAVGKKTGAPAKAAATKVVGKPVTAKAPQVTKAVTAAKPAPKAAAATKVVAATKPAVKAAPKVAAKPAPKVEAKPAPKVEAKPAPKAVAKPAPKPEPKPIVKPVVKAVVKPVVKAVVKPVVKAVAKPVIKAAPKPVVKAAPKKISSGGSVASLAIPGETAPSTLDGSLVGDVGFDPCFLSTKADSAAGYFNSIVGGTNIDGLTWYREAELMHGRICMLAVVGFIAPGFGTISGNEWTGVDAYSATNPLEAFSTVPGASLFQILAFMAALEFRRINIIKADGSSYQAGDSQKWGQGEGRYNPFNLNYTPEQYAEKQLQELKHGRLAMIGILGVYFQATNSGVSVVDQLSAAFVTPEYYAKAGYFLPEGI